MKIEIELEAGFTAQLYPTVKQALDVLAPIALTKINVFVSGKALEFDQATKETN